MSAQSELSFVTKQMGVAVDGRFRSFDAQISLDPLDIKGHARELVLPVTLTQAGRNPRPPATSC